MRVKAIREGYYEYEKRKVNTEFTIKGPEAFSFVWMEPVNEEDWYEVKVWEKNNPKRKRYKPAGFKYPVTFVDEELNDEGEDEEVAAPLPQKKKQVLKKVEEVKEEKKKVVSKKKAASKKKKVIKKIASNSDKEVI